jgi:hypothetical protein
MKGSEQEKAKIEILKDGPCLVSGGLPLSEQHIVTNEEGGQPKLLETNRPCAMIGARNEPGLARWRK